MPPLDSVTIWSVYWLHPLGRCHSLPGNSTSASRCISSESVESALSAQVTGESLHGLHTGQTAPNLYQPRRRPLFRQCSQPLQVTEGFAFTSALLHLL